MEEIIKLIAVNLDLQTEDVKPESEIRDLTEDSLDLIELILALEDRFQIDIPDEELNRLVTVKDVADYIESVSSQCGAV
jgi:acyl carrier protein